VEERSRSHSSADRVLGDRLPLDLRQLVPPDDCPKIDGHPVLVLGTKLLPAHLAADVVRYTTRVTTPPGPHVSGGLFRRPVTSPSGWPESIGGVVGPLAGFLVHVAKPVDPAELVATVATVTGRVDPLA
jgi:hypothetical protein